MDSKTFADCFLAEIKRTIDVLPRAEIDAAVNVLFETWENHGAVFIMGNGGSASTATHFACDLAKCTIVVGKPRLKAMALVNNIPLVSAWTNDTGFGAIFAEQLEPWLEEGDVLIGLSVHGGSGSGDAGLWSRNLVRAMKLARERGAKVIGLSGFDGGAMRELADVCIVVPLSEEPLATPLVESFHVILHHLIANALRRRIDQAQGSVPG